MRKLMIVLLVITVCFLGTLPLLAQNSHYLTLQEYEKATGKSIKNFQEAPMLREKVARGELPPVEERLPEQPYVVVPRERIGRYGGTLHVITRYTTVPVGAGFVQDVLNGFVEPNPAGDKLLPHFATEIEVSEDKTTYTIHLREGAKWSDGVPFTADDIMFWYEDILLNKELTPAISSVWKAGGEVVKVRKLDDYTVQFKFAKPQPEFLGWPFSKATQHFRMLKPKHYFKQFHPKYTPMEELKKKVKEAGFDKWYDFFWAKAEEYCGLSAVPGTPVLTPYMPVEATASRRVFVRNPYYWKVDTEGNQLPYIDKIVEEIVTDPEVAQGKIISGEVDFNGFLTTTKNYPMYKKNEQKGGYRTILWDSGKASEVIFFFNLTHQDPVLRQIFRDVRFRRAMSLAINRQEINDFLYFGKAKIMQYTVVASKYFEPEFANAYVEYNPEKAKALLDEMGLVDTDGDGWRERPDGKKLTFTIEFTSAEDPLKTDTVELVANYWRAVGVDVKVKEISGELFDTRGSGNSLDCSIWHGGFGDLGILFPELHPGTDFPGPIHVWPRFKDYYFRGEKIQQSIPKEVRKLFEVTEKVLTTPDEEERVRLGKEILRLHAENLWIIGTVGFAPHPIVVDKDLHNVPEKGHWCWEVQWMTTRDPEQLFFGPDEGKPGNK